MGTVTVAQEHAEQEQRTKNLTLFQRLQATFLEPYYVTLQEVRDATGFDGTSIADAMAVSLYRSRGKSLWGFEFKVSRSDWLRELKQPEKAESILRYCHHWALVVPDKDIVKPGELPSTWGMYVAYKDKLKPIVPAPLLDPIPLDMKMFTAIIYAVNQRLTRADTAALEKAKAEGYKQGKESISRYGQDWEKQYRELQEKVDAFDKASGLNIRYGWGKTEKIGRAVQLLLDGDRDIKDMLRHLEYACTRFADTKESIEKQMEVVKQYLAGQTMPITNADDEA